MEWNGTKWVIKETVWIRLMRKEQKERRGSRSHGRKGNKKGDRTVGNETDTITILGRKKKTRIPKDI